MKIVILGAGQVGRTAAYQLAREEANEVTVVDTNEELLVEENIDSCDTFVALTNSE
ncbi:MAG: potassium transporter TrkA, partial [Gammaproteobacteria bacterium]|nr:potassium transporter TrkA [Gammaproteobacteria bacterium]